MSPRGHHARDGPDYVSKSTSDELRAPMHVARVWSRSERCTGTSCVLHIRNQIDCRQAVSFAGYPSIPRSQRSVQRGGVAALHDDTAQLVRDMEFRGGRGQAWKDGQLVQIPIASSLLKHWGHGVAMIVPQSLRSPYSARRLPPVINVRRHLYDLSLC